MNALNDKLDSSLAFAATWGGTIVSLVKIPFFTSTFTRARSPKVRDAHLRAGPEVSTSDLEFKSGALDKRSQPAAIAEVNAL